MATFSTIHIFGFGDVQMIGSEKEGTVKAISLTKLAAFVDHIKTFKPEDVTLTDYHVIHIFNGMDVRYLGKAAEDKNAETSFSVKMDQVNTTILDELVTEIVATIPAETPNAN
jgi:hypothetical protein